LAAVDVFKNPFFLATLKDNIRINVRHFGGIFAAFLVSSHSRTLTDFQVCEKSKKRARIYIIQNLLSMAKTA
jgi:hypothetical protein